MFIKELWTYSKQITLTFILFILLWSYINYKQGAVAAPLFEYGMYSGKFLISDTQRVIQLYANNKIIDLTKYSIIDRDLLQISLQYYVAQKPVNEGTFLTMKRILDHAYIGHLMQKEKYTNNISDKEFTHWYIQLVERIVGYPITNLAAYEQKYLWKNDRLVPVSSLLKLTSIVTN
ncbi:MAG TPA: hypothetical protein VK705_02550 [Ferruginibacter sp.]|jgi:hypothetical protein|nr:hypothetical protein [Ferruginibacter sp.]